MKYRAVVLLTLLLIALPNDAGDKDLRTLVSWMSGVFSSQKQAAEDDRYYPIRLVMTPIWKERTDGYWLYVEQAAEGHFHKPYRQRVYHLKRNQDGRFESVVYSLEEPLQYAGVWQEENPLGLLTPADLSVREGCSVFLNFAHGKFIGSTHEQDCVSTLRGAAYATSEITISAKMVLSWDRGFDASGNQVWGAEKAGYIFRREGTVADLAKEK